MLGNYLTTALRLLWRERGYAAINIFGLAIGLALCLLLVQFVAYQLAVGDLHEKKDRVYRVLGPSSMSTGSTEYTETVPIELGPTLKEQLPEVEEAVRFAWRAPLPLRAGAKDAISEIVMRAEAGVFDMFSLPLLRGDPKTALARPHTLVLTEPLARRLFGESDPIGEVVRVGGIGKESDYEVTGIVGQPPASSLIQFSALISFATMYHDHEPMIQAMMAQNSVRAFKTFVQLRPDADPAAVAARIPGIVAETTGLQDAADSYALQPLQSIYFDTKVPNSVGSMGNPMYLALCALLAVVILTIAGVNYVNLATARAGRRTHEIGVRKALGAHRGQLIGQLLSESVLLSVGATVLGVAMAEVALLFLSSIAGFELVSSMVGFRLSFLRWTLLACAGAAALAVGVGLVAGAYPAYVVARFQPETAVRRGRVGGTHLRQGLVVAQFTVTATLLTMTLLIWHQVDYIQNLLREDSALGFEPEQVVVVHNLGITSNQARTFKTELLQDSRIAAVSLTQTVPGGGSKAMYRVEAEGVEEKVMMIVYNVDGDFVEILGLQMAQGRDLTDEATDEVVINEAAARMLGWTEPLGKTINFKRQDRRVVGVIEDFHFDGPHRKIEPLLIGSVHEHDLLANLTLVRVGPGHLDEALKVIDAKWAATNSDRSIQRQSLEEVFVGLYREELMMGRVLTVFLVLAIVVASIGLFGMAAHAAQERTKEIGIRKVFGASPGGLTAMMLRDFAKPVAIAFLLSIPIAHWLASQWLQDYAYHVEAGVGLFLVSGALSFAIAGLTVGHQAMRAAQTNPIDTLQTE